MIDCQLYGLDAGNHHQTNLLFHARERFVAFLPFARHDWEPSAGETVGGRVFCLASNPRGIGGLDRGQKRCLKHLFWMLTVCEAYVAYVRRPGAMRYGLVLVLYALGLMSKPMLVTMPCVLLLLDFWPLKRAPLSSEPGAALAGLTTWPRLVLEKVPLFAMSLASSVVTYCVKKAGGASSLHQLPAGGRIANALVSYARYLGKSVLANRISPFLYPIKEHWPLGQTIPERD